ncbi:MAG: virulence factor, partial [Chthoniobacterales bacterium]
MPGTLTTIWWRDIPAQVVAARDRRTQHKIVLHRRFQVAIDRAAVQAGK